jgi:hypothetical protein
MPEFAGRLSYSEYGVDYPVPYELEEPFKEAPDNTPAPDSPLPPLTPTPITPLSTIEVVGATTGENKYIVRENGFQKIMTKAQIEKAGGTIPVKVWLESEVHTAVMGGENYEKAVERIVGKYEAQKSGMTQKELTDPITGANREEQLQNFADKYGLSLTSAAKLIKEYNDNPDAPEFKKLNRWEKRDLAEFEGAKDYIESTSESVAWKKINKAVKKNPNILKTIYVNGHQRNVLNLEEAAVSGLTDPEIFNLVGREQAGSPVPTLIKTNKDDPGTLYTGGWTGVTKNQIYEILNVKREREELDTLLKEKGVSREDTADKLIGAGIEDKRTLNKLGLNMTDEDIQSVTDFNKFIKADDTPEELKKAYNDKGYAGYLQAYNTYKTNIDKELAQFNEDNIMLGDKYMARADFEKLDPKYQKIALEGGFGALKASIDQDEARQAAALDKLKDYEVGKLKPGEYGPASHQYEIDKFIKDNPTQDSVAVLRTAGFSDDTIKAAENYISVFESARNEINSIVEYEDKLNKAATGWGATKKVQEIQKDDPGAGKRLSLTYAIDDAGGDVGMGTPAQVVKAWNSLTDAQKEQVISAYSADQFKSSGLGVFLHGLSVSAQEKGLAGQIIAAPITGITEPIAKQVAGQKVTGGEWAMAGATAVFDALLLGGGSALLGLGAGGKAALIGVQAAATGVVGYSQTKQDWTEMSKAEIGVTVAFDILMLTGLGLSIKSPVRIKVPAGEPTPKIVPEKAYVISKEPGIQVTEAIKSSGAEISKGTENRLNSTFKNMADAIAENNKVKLESAAVELGNIIKQLPDNAPRSYLRNQVMAIKADPEIFIKTLQDAGLKIKPGDFNTNIENLQKVYDTSIAKVRDIRAKTEVPADIKVKMSQAQQVRLQNALTATEKVKVDRGYNLLKQKGELPKYHSSIKSIRLWNPRRRKKLVMNRW